ncbi:GTP-binding domain [Rhizobium phage RL38J1]|uniref:YspA cpYpsA-related SLOG domain-containing protein n=2 Tax=Innesvirus TaxID=3044739 RepID=A0A6B9J1R8_9CAUD|nr:GTP-binding domain [Rhizobium phage RL38J1]YP_010662896.1 GTP-binding domain [Rhizobium phage RL2RES]QGZ13958.1 hypothetical protein RL38J1_089 [Rhizobium phage RL38J1]QGZ14224.1 protein of unknown function DUF2493 [Rhizobium phage RL2RES]
MRVIITGGRDFKDVGFVISKLLGFCKSVQSEADLSMAAGGARNVDTFAKIFALSREIPFEEFLPDWDKYATAAGPIRNKEMLEEFKPDAVLAFPGGTGTAHMKEISRKAGVPVIDFALEYNHEGLDL